MAGNESGLVRFVVPNLPADLPVGTYSLRVLVQRPGETTRRESNQLALTIVPRITTAMPIGVARDAQGDVTVALTCSPEVRPHQRASIIVGALEALAEPHDATTNALSFEIVDAPVGTHFLRLRIDGIDSILVDRSVTPPVFLDRRVVIT